VFSRFLSTTTTSTVHYYYYYYYYQQHYYYSTTAVLRRGKELELSQVAEKRFDISTTTMGQLQIDTTMTEKRLLVSPRNGSSNRTSDGRAVVPAPTSPVVEEPKRLRKIEAETLPIVAATTTATAITNMPSEVLARIFEFLASSNASSFSSSCGSCDTIISALESMLASYQGLTMVSKRWRRVILDHGPLQPHQWHTAIFESPGTRDDVIKRLSVLKSYLQLTKVRAVEVVGVVVK